MTNQEAFEKVVRHLLKQNAQALGTNGYECQYRAPDGKMCAVGCLINDEEYKSEFEGKLASDITKLVPSLQGLDLKLLFDLQIIHDESTPKYWKARLKGVSIMHDLTFPKDI